MLYRVVLHLLIRHNKIEFEKLLEYNAANLQIHPILRTAELYL